MARAKEQRIRHQYRVFRVAASGNRNPIGGYENTMGLYDAVCLAMRQKRAVVLSYGWNGDVRQVLTVSDGVFAGEPAAMQAANQSCEACQSRPVVHRRRKFASLCDQCLMKERRLPR